mmetsp:Transcript_52599/g.140173  ORF Transcript_52599/g.140173 Transcript_52599/m.140173 type:complete len:200 (+) Transcript_52599:2013-2612(+)
MSLKSVLTNLWTARKAWKRVLVARRRILKTLLVRYEGAFLGAFGESCPRFSGHHAVAVTLQGERIAWAQEERSSKLQVALIGIWSSAEPERTVHVWNLPLRATKRNRTSLALVNVRQWEWKICAFVDSLADAERCTSTTCVAQGIPKENDPLSDVERSCSLEEAGTAVVPAQSSLSNLIPLITETDTNLLHHFQTIGPE